MTPQEFKLLFDQNFDAIRNYIFYRLGDADLATDVAQDIFMRLWEKQIEFSQKGNTGLLYKMAGDEVVNIYRRQKVKLNYTKSISFDLEGVSPEDELQYKELKLAYEKSLQDLSEKQRTVFLMSRMDGLKYHEIAERLGISIKSVEKRMKNALKLLKFNLFAQ